MTRAVLISGLLETAAQEKRINGMKGTKVLLKEDPIFLNFFKAFVLKRNWTSRPFYKDLATGQVEAPDFFFHPIKIIMKRQNKCQGKRKINPGLPFLRSF
jgi:hypothetical protein